MFRYVPYYNIEMKKTMVLVPQLQAHPYRYSYRLHNEDYLPIDAFYAQNNGHVDNRCTTKRVLKLKYMELNSWRNWCSTEQISLHSNKLSSGASLHIERICNDIDNIEGSTDILIKDPELDQKCKTDFV